MDFRKSKEIRLRMHNVQKNYKKCMLLSFNYDTMSASEKNVLAHSASDELDHESQIHDITSTA